MFTLSFIRARLGKLLALLPLLTAKKLVNLLAAVFLFLIRSDRSVAHPPFIVLSLTSHCNFRCIMCKKSSTKKNASLFDYDHPRDMDIERLEQLLREHADYLCLVYLHGGEPLAHEHIHRLLALLNELRIPYQIGTNGSLLTEDMNEVLVDGCCVGVGISIDAATAETYRSMRVGGDFHRLTGNLRSLGALIDAKGTGRPILSASMCVFAQNVREMVGLVELCREHRIQTLSVTEGWDYTTPGIREEHLIRNNIESTRASLRAARQRARELGVRLIASFPSLEEERERSPIRTPGSVTHRNCLNLYASTWVMPDLGLIGCSNATQPLGSLRTESFAQIWNSRDSGYVASRRALREGRVPDGCSKCIYSGSFFS